MIKNFTIFKNNHKENDNQPDYNISANVGDSYKTIGACWKKEKDTDSVDENGNPIKRNYLSCKLQDAYNDRKGFSLTEDKTEEKKEVETKDTTEDSISSEDIPF